MDIIKRLEKQRRGEDFRQDDDHEAVAEETGNGFVIIEGGRRRKTERQSVIEVQQQDEEECNFNKLCCRGTQVGSLPGAPKLSARLGKGRRRGRESRTTRGQTSEVKMMTERHRNEDEGCRMREFDGMIDRFGEMCRSSMEASDGDVFASLLALAQSADRTNSDEGMFPIPTGLIMAGGVNSADHAQMLPRLKRYLQGKGCRVALLSPGIFTRGMSAIVSKMMDELKEDSEGIVSDTYTLDDMYEWYGLLCREKQTLVPPIVIIVEALETTDSAALQDLICCLSESYHKIPHTLMVGITTTHAALTDAISYEVIDTALECHRFDMVRIIRLLSIHKCMKFENTGVLIVCSFVTFIGFCHAKIRSICRLCASRALVWIND